MSYEGHAMGGLLARWTEDGIRKGTRETVDGSGKNKAEITRE